MGKEESRIKRNFKESNKQNVRKMEPNLMSKSYDKSSNTKGLNQSQIKIQNYNMTDRKYEKSPV